MYVVCICMHNSGSASTARGGTRPDRQDGSGSTQTAGHKVRSFHRRPVTGSDHARRTASVHGPSGRHTQDGRSDCTQHVLTHRRKGYRNVCLLTYFIVPTLFRLCYFYVIYRVPALALNSRPAMKNP